MTNYLLDSNIVSESTKPRPNARVVEWVALQQRHSFISTISIGEVRYGVDRLAGERQRIYRTWLVALCADKKGRILCFNSTIAHIWGHLRAKWEAAGLTMPIADSQIAATAVRHQLTIATRNVGDFRRAGLKVFNPFDPGGETE